MTRHLNGKGACFYVSPSVLIERDGLKANLIGWFTLSISGKWFCTLIARLNEKPPVMFHGRFLSSLEGQIVARILPAVGFTDDLKMQMGAAGIAGVAHVSNHITLGDK